MTAIRRSFTISASLSVCVTAVTGRIHAGEWIRAPSRAARAKRRYHRGKESEDQNVRTFSTVVLGLWIAAAASASPEKAAAPAAVTAQSAAPATAAAPAPASPAAAEPAYFRIELAPSGSYVAIGAPAVKNGAMVFKAYPDGKLMSLRKSDVRRVSAITAKEAAGPVNKDLVSIGNLAMQGGSAPASGGGHPATGSPTSAMHGPQGAALIPTRDGLAISTNPSAANQGPSVVNMPDGVGAVSAPAQPNPK
jgi:hypothetical protein